MLEVVLKVLKNFKPSFDLYLNVTRLSWPERVSVNCMVFRLLAKFFFFAKFSVNLFDKKLNFHKIRKVKISR